MDTMLFVVAAGAVIVGLGVVIINLRTAHRELQETLRDRERQLGAANHEAARSRAAQEEASFLLTALRHSEEDLGSARRRIGELEPLQGEVLEARSALSRADDELGALRPITAKYQTVIDVEARVQELEREATGIRETAAQQAESIVGAARTEAEALRSESAALRTRYQSAKAQYDQLAAELRSVEESLEDISVGHYKPHFTYSDTESFKHQIELVRKDQKWMIRSGYAVRCRTEWSVGGSRQAGEKMTKQYEKLVLRAFNGEVDAAIANVSWNNVTVMENRISKAFAALNKLGTVMQVSLTEEFRDSRLRELRLVHEAAELKQRQREEERRRRAAEREEERVQKELARERDRAAKEEAKFEAAIATAREELERSIDAERDAMTAQIQELEAKLAEAHDRKERAIAQAQLTKVGHVYIISNLGAFGDGVVKIGLTRRLEPVERIKELGDASVPFPFDLHALVYSEDAPGLEAELHNRFWERRINWANDRKEFFRITVDDVHAALAELGLEASFHKVAAAREYRETVALISQRETQGAADAAVRPERTTPRFVDDPFFEQSGALSA